MNILINLIKLKWSNTVLCCFEMNQEICTKNGEKAPLFISPLNSWIMSVKEAESSFNLCCIFYISLQRVSGCPKYISKWPGTYSDLFISIERWQIRQGTADTEISTYCNSHTMNVTPSDLINWLIEVDCSTCQRCERAQRRGRAVAE